MSKSQANLLLVIVTIGWGSSYLFTKFALEELQPITLVGVRFLIAFVITFLFFIKRMLKLRKATIAVSAILGAFLCAVSVLFSVALKYTEASTAGFLFATTVIFVPVIMTILTRQLPSRTTQLGAVVTLIGLALFSLQNGITFSYGMLICIVSAFIYAGHIVLNNYLVRTHDAIQLGVMQLGFGGAFALIIGLLTETFALPVTSTGWFALFMLAVVCSAFAVIAQSVVLKYTTAIATGFILSLEPIFAAILAMIFLGEQMNVQEVIGAAVIFTGVLIANVIPSTNR